MVMRIMFSQLQHLVRPPGSHIQGPWAWEADGISTSICGGAQAQGSGACQVHEGWIRTLAGRAMDGERAGKAADTPAVLRCIVNLHRRKIALRMWLLEIVLQDVELLEYAVRTHTRSKELANALGERCSKPAASSLENGDSNGRASRRTTV